MVAWEIILSLLLIQMMMWVLVARYTELPPQVPLWYVRPWGEPQLAETLQIWAIPTLATVVLGLNLPLALYFYPRERKLAQLLVFFTLLVSALGAWALFLILSRIRVL